MLTSRIAEIWQFFHSDRPPVEIREHEMDWERFRSLVEVMVEALPPQQRVAVKWVDLRGFLPAEVARRLGKTPGSFRSQLCRGRRKVRTALEGTSSDLVWELLGEGFTNEN
jgi:DNA-directed RNA polymerase specialized sigma24 family protein